MSPVRMLRERLILVQALLVLDLAMRHAWLIAAVWVVLIAVDVSDLIRERRRRNLST